MPLKPTFPTPEFGQQLGNPPRIGPVEIAGHTLPEPPMTARENRPRDQSVAGVREMHAEDFTQNASLFHNNVPGSLAAGADFPILQSPSGNVTYVDLPFMARSFVIDNLTGYTLFIPSANRFIAPAVIGRVMRLQQAIRNLRVIVISGSVGSTPQFGMIATEAVLTENAGISALGGITTGTFPAASPLADADPNPTTTRVGADVSIWNGATWDRWKEVVASFAGQTVVGISEVGPMLFNGTSFFPLSAAGGNIADASGGNNIGTTDIYLWNGTTFDRQRSDIDTGALITATGATTTQTTADQTNVNFRGLRVVLDMTVVGTGSVTVHIQGKDTASGVYDDILVSAAIVANSHNIYRVYPGLTAAANLVANDILPRIWRIQVVANNANATTYTVGVQLEL